jgi:hypothetical protein
LIVPEKIEKGVGSGDGIGGFVGGLHNDRSVGITQCDVTRPDDLHQNYPQDNGHHCGGEIVNDSPHADFATGLGFQGGQTGDQGGHDQRQNHNLQHVQEDVADEGDVHDFPVIVVEVQLAQAETQSCEKKERKKSN